MSELPFVSVIIVNYNGAHYLEISLPALRAQDYPPDRFEVIVSDNDSRDSSLSLLQNQFTWVKVLKNGRNIGFASGNNVAIREARGDFIIFMNNDTAPSQGWINEMVKAALQFPKAGLITGHLQLFYDELDIAVETEAVTFPGDPRSLGIQVYGVNSGAIRGVVQYKEGFYGWETSQEGERFRWCQSRAVIGVPIPSRVGDIEISLKLAVPLIREKPVPVTVRLNGDPLACFEINDSHPSDFNFRLNNSQCRLAVPNEQNTGSIIFKNGMGRDRGTYVRGTEAFFERDEGHYNQAEEVFAGCGASLLFRREAFDDIGYFDDHFFMYYEDTDLCWRAWLKGWKVIYAPEARIRHIHSGTTKEWSPFFLYLIERNRLEMIFKNGAMRQMANTWGGFSLKVIRTGFTAVYQTILQHPGWRQNVKSVLIQLRVVGSLLLMLPVLIIQRIQIQSTRRVTHESLSKWFEEP